MVGVAATIAGPARDRPLDRVKPRTAALGQVVASGHEVPSMGQGDDLPCQAQAKVRQPCS